MKLYAQIGHGLGEKVGIGLEEKLIDGAISVPKTCRKTRWPAAFPKSAENILKQRF